MGFGQLFLLLGAVLGGGGDGVAGGGVHTGFAAVAGVLLFQELDFLFKLQNSSGHLINFLLFCSFLGVSYSVCFRFLRGMPVSAVVAVRGRNRPLWFGGEKVADIIVLE